MPAQSIATAAESRDERVEHKLDAAGNTQLFEYPKEIFLYRVLAEAKLAGHIPIAQAISDQRHHLLFTRGQQFLFTCAHNSKRRHLANGVEKEAIGGDLCNCEPEIGENKSCARRGRRRKRRMIPNSALILANVSFQLLHSPVPVSR